MLLSKIRPIKTGNTESHSSSAPVDTHNNQVEGACHSVLQRDDLAAWAREECRPHRLSPSPLWRWLSWPVLPRLFILWCVSLKLFCYYCITKRIRESFIVESRGSGNHLYHKQESSRMSWTSCLLTWYLSEIFRIPTLLRWAKNASKLYYFRCCLFCYSYY